MAGLALTGRVDGLPIAMIEQIVSFVTVVDAGGFSQASRRLALPKSTISHRVQQLEERLGVRLLHRTSRVVRLTDEGDTYYRRCVHVLAELQDAESEIHQAQADPTGTLRLTGPIEFGMQVLSNLLAGFLKAHPLVGLKLELTSRVVDLVEEGYDAAVRIGKLEDSALISRRILTVPRGVYASPEYLDKYGCPEKPDDLSGHACLRFETTLHGGMWVFSGPNGRHSFQPSGTVQSNNLTILRDAAIAGLGVVLLPCYQCHEAERTGILKRLMVEWTPEGADVYVVYPSKRHLASRVRAFLTYVDKNVDRLTRDIAQI